MMPRDRYIARTRFILNIPLNQAFAVKGALYPELSSPPPGSIVSIDEEQNVDHRLILDVISEDLSSHRASINSYLGLIQAVVSALEGPALEKNK